MDVKIIPTYHDFFNDESPDINQLIETIPSRMIICILAHFDAQLLRNDNPDTQRNLLHLLVGRQPIAILSSLMNRVATFLQNEKDHTTIFSRPYIKSFLHYELTHYRNLPDIDDLTPEQELYIFKAYLVITTIRSNELFNTSFREAQICNEDFFSTHTWPAIITQYDINQTINPIPYFIKSICFLNYLQYRSEYSQHVRQFLVQKGMNRSWDYIMFLMNWTQLSYNTCKSDIIASCINGNSKNQSLLNYLSIDPVHYQEKYKNRAENYTELKNKPLFKYKDNYIVLDWNFIANKIYDGLIFDFHTDSGISKLSIFNTIPKFKNYVALHITEKFIFRTILEYLLGSKYSILEFDNNCDNGFPDAYYRKGNNIILFEIKDAFFPSSAIDSNSHEQIKDAINEKYNNERKGIGQIIKHIRKLQTSSFENSQEFNKVKKRNLNIYPVIIYTDKYFGMPGISNYMIDQFNEKINKENIRRSFRKISNLTFLNLNFLIDQSKFIHDNNFIILIDKIHHEIATRKKKQAKFSNMEYLLKYHENIEEIYKSIFKVTKDDMLDTKELYDRLNMGEGFPK